MDFAGLSHIRKPESTRGHRQNQGKFARSPFPLQGSLKSGNLSAYSFNSLA